MTTRILMSRNTSSESNSWNYVWIDSIAYTTTIYTTIMKLIDKVKKMQIIEKMELIENVDKKQNSIKHTSTRRQNSTPLTVRLTVSISASH